MRLYLDGYFTFYSYQQQPWIEIELKEPAPLSVVLSDLGIPIAEVHLAVVNGEAVVPDEALISGQDEVKLFPPLGGG
jgi:molybdopterin converting factor small subunit